MSPDEEARRARWTRDKQRSALFLAAYGPPTAGASPSSGEVTESRRQGVPPHFCLGPTAPRVEANRQDV
ncbi:hypothetical protein [Paludisphaera mucosa]|uniref:Uncharacterized protein n=1 Tax=Paludisphaera mucosa TaxID=3030827 RepID=A0ABT6FLP7_9BACT|nr:hypothetical protein [Paludisphaera mucosa]MDG3008491.1 hypothetical protein [Paludisphaera mucosa]